MLLIPSGGLFEYGRRLDALVSNVDILPTLCEVVGIEPPPGIDGRSLLPLIRDKAGAWRSHLFVEQTYHAAYDPVRGVRTERYKYIRSFARRPVWLAPNVDDGYSKDWYRNHQPAVFHEPRPAELLFDLQHDPLERCNLADASQYADVLKEMRQLVKEQMRWGDDPLRHGHVPMMEGARVTPASVWGPEDDLTQHFDPEEDVYPPV